MFTNLRYTAIWLVAILVLLVANCSKPVRGEKELLGKIKGKTSLRLADGSTISRPGTDEYNPYLVKLSDGYLALVYGSNQGGDHELYMTKSTTAFDGEFIPFFDTPQMVTSGINETSKLTFAAKASGTNVIVYVNYSGGISSATVDPTNPGSASLGSITNLTVTGHTIIGISADGNRLYSTDLSGIGNSIDPNGSGATPFGYGMDYATSVTQVRQENSGTDDAILGVYYGSSYAAAGETYYGPIFDLDTSLAFSGLSITNISTFMTDSPANDIVLFSAFDYFEGFTEDLYVITSHTAGDLWDVAGFPGFDFIPPTAPPATHWFDMYDPSTDCIDYGFPGGLTATCANIVTSTTGSYDGTEAGEFDGSSSIMYTGTKELSDYFSIAAWVNVTSVTGCGTGCAIAANSASFGGIAAGFRLYVDTAGAVQFQTGNGAASSGISTMSGLILDTTWHHVIVSVDRMTGFAAIYIDGYDESTSNSVLTDFSTNAVLTFGASAPTGTPTNFLGGLMDEIKIYGFPLDATMAELAYYE